jgi:hypothetical protein
MHWERTYFWQDEEDERQWCLECTTCEELTKSDWGAGCEDSDNNSGTDCLDEDQLWIQNCNGFRGSSGNTEFEIVRGSEFPSADQLKIRNKNLCMERVDDILLHLRPCDKSEVKQLWVGFHLDRPFDLQPLQQNLLPSQYNDPVDTPPLCISQQHHPKKYEILYLEICDVAQRDNTALWDAI